MGMPLGFASASLAGAVLADEVWPRCCCSVISVAGFAALARPIYRQMTQLRTDIKCPSLSSWPPCWSEVDIAQGHVFVTQVLAVAYPWRHRHCDDVGHGGEINGSHVGTHRR